ncbi:MAG TPA: undecaprenyl-diphosphate phosphatase [Acidimicrobiia bacterium]|nr:undecaprenyl-diphosphate phosphatase [Acidimicrobiia bacterium]
MLSAIIWGLVQGLTEFLPISSSGHLVLVPAFLSAAGLELEEPSLAVSAVLHLGTLAAVLVYFRSDVLRLLRFRHDRDSRRLWLLLIIGTIPALIGLPLRDPLERLQDDPRLVGVALLGTALILLVGSRLLGGRRVLEQARPIDAVVVGLAQAVALIPGVSRSGSTIVAGTARGLSPAEAARYSFLLGIPTIAGGGLLSLVDVSESGGLEPSLIVGLVVAAVSGYAAIALVLAALRRVGLIPFAVYAMVVGVAAIVLL